MSSVRIYRNKPGGLRLTSFTVKVKESDLWIAVSSGDYSSKLPEQVEQLVFNRRNILEEYLAKNPFLKTTLEPSLVEDNAPVLFKAMAAAANRAGVGPMAAVAGAFAEMVGLYLQDVSSEVIVENGGDIFIKAVKPLNVGIYAGKSPLSGEIAIKIDPDQTPLGVCTSSGTIGPSLSFGRADAAIALSPSVPLADAVATAMGNRVRVVDDLEAALNYARTIEDITGALLICQDKIAAWGDLELVRTC